MLDTVIRTVASDQLQADDQPPADEELRAIDEPPADDENGDHNEPPADDQDGGHYEPQVHYVIPDRTQPPALGQPPANDPPQIDDGAVVAYTEQRWRYTLPYPKLEVEDILTFSQQDKSLQFVCNFCRENFPTYEEMQFHRGAHLGDGPIDPVSGLPMSPSRSDQDPQVWNQIFEVNALI